MLHYSTDPDGETPQSMRSCPDDWGLGESGPDEPVAWGRVGSSSDFTHSPKNQEIIPYFFGQRKVTFVSTKSVASKLNLSGHSIKLVTFTHCHRTPPRRSS